MAKKRRSRSRSTSPHTNEPTQHAPAGIMQHTSKVVANAATAAARQLMNSGSKAMRRNKNQGSDAMVQQGDGSTTENAQGASASNDNESGVNTTQEHVTVDRNALLLSDLESRAPRFMTNTTNRTSPSNRSRTMTPTSGATPSTSLAPAPIPSSQASAPTPSATPPSSQNATLALNIPYGINPSTPPRLNASGISGVTDAGEDLLSGQGTSMGVGESYVPTPSPRRNTQSPETHQLQQTLRNNAMATVARSDSSSDSGNCGPFNSLLENDTSVLVETVQEGGLDDDGGWPEGGWPDDDMNPRLSNEHDPSSTYDSGLQKLHIDTEDPGIADFALNVGALGNASGTPMDGAQNMSFGGESTVDGGNADGGNQDVTSNINLDSCDPSVIATMLTRPPGANTSSPTTIHFNEQVLVTNYSPNHSPKHTLGTATSTLTGISGSNSNTEPTQGDPTSMQNSLSQGQPTSGNCQPRGHCASVDDHGAGSECSVLICYSHNSHSLSNYSVDLAVEVDDHGHMRLGYELSNGSTVHSTVTVR